jgi:mono/diheme cytochrome c family protein
MTSESTPRPISGGTLAVSPDGRIIVAADADRETVHVGHTVALQNVARGELPTGSEPGRVVLTANAAHVVLRGSHKLVRIDLDSAKVTAEASPCNQPRGLSYDAAHDAVVAACMDGNVVTLAAASYAEQSRTFAGYDLRDVALGAQGQLFVSRFRSAELIALKGSAQSVQRPRPAAVTRFGVGLLVPDIAPAAEADAGSALPPNFGPMQATLSPTLAWRSITTGDGVWMLHQQSLDGQVSTSPGGYGGACAPITQGAITRFDMDGVQTGTMPIALHGVSVDLAISADGQWLAVASPGAYLQAGFTLQVYATARLTTEFVADGCGDSANAGGGSTGQAVAVAFDAAGLLYSLNREPAEIEVSRLPKTVGAGLERVATIALDSRSMRDTGHDLFHADVGSGLACASCHGEALDDGHVWNFENIGPRRTQNMRGGLIGTAPFHWDGDMTSFQHLVDDVMTGRMGGFAVQSDYADALGSWIDRQPALRLPASDSAAADRGKALFTSSATKCATCHSGDALTNNQSAEVGTGGVFQVPSLRGLALRAPYMHDGCAKTLADRFVPACGGGDKHGVTSQLTPDQIADLTAYLATL